MSSTAAPGSLESVRSFVNTVEPEDGLELAQADGSLPEWCAMSGLPDPSPDELEALRGLREALRGVLETHSGDGDRDGAWAPAAPYASQVSLKMEWCGAAGLKLRPTGGRLHAVIGELFVSIYEAMSSGTWTRLKACRKASCRWAFYDRSKNGSGAWCSMRVCGNRVKAQRRRRREKTAPGQPGET